METLTNYITERIRIDNVQSTGFPIGGKIDEILQFLRKNGFVEVESDKKDTWNITHEIFSINKNKKVFTYNPHIGILRFADMTKDIDDDNPIFVVRPDRSDIFWLEPALHSAKEKVIDPDTMRKLTNKYF
jgi:hypothetical protein